MAAPSNPLQSFIWGRGGAALTPEQVAREREIAEALMASGADTSPVAHWLQGAARLGSTLSGKVREGRASSAEAAGRSAYSDRFNSLFGGGEMAATPPVMGGSPATSTAMATAPAPDYASARVAQAHGDSTQPAGNLSESKQAFISALMPAAMEESKRTGVDPRIIVAQAAQETGWGRSAPGNNYFGIKSHGKGGGQTFKTHEYVNGKRVNISDNFRRFESPADSVRGYGDFIINNPRYGKLREAQGLDAQLEALQASGYATDPNYSSSVGAIARGIPMPDAVAANEAMASGDLNPQAVQDWAAQNYAPQPDVMVAESPEQIAAAEAAMMDPAFMQSDVTVAETPEEILAAEAAMAAPQGTQPRLEPVMAAPPLPAPTMVPDMQVAEIAQALTGNQVNPDVPMAGNTSGFAPMGVQAPNVSLPQEASFSLPNPQQQIAQSLAGQPQQQGGGQPSMQQLVQAVSDPWATDAQRQVAGALLKQQMQANDPMSQLQLQKAQLELDAMRNPQQKPIEVGGVLVDPTTYEPLFDSRKPDPGFRLLTPEELQGVPGLDPSKAYQAGPDNKIYEIGGGGVNVNVGSEGQRMGTVPAGMAAVPDPSNPSGFRLEAIPGGPAAIDANAAAAQQGAQTISDAQKAETTLDATRSVLDILDKKGESPATGTLSRPFALYSGSPAGRVRSYVGTLQSGVALGAMQRLKELSSTGATGFGALSAPELNLLISDIGALDPDNTEPDIFRKTIERIQDRSKRVAMDIAKNVSPERIQELGLQSFIDGFNQADAPGGVDPADWEFMSPEERALFQ